MAEKEPEQPEYEAPTLVDLGTAEELTDAAPGGFGDAGVESHVSGF